MRISDWSSDVCSSDLLFARSYLSGLVLFSLAALAQGGTYTPGIMLIADRYPPERRGAAMGWLIASTSLGYALSLVLSSEERRAGKECARTCRTRWPPST